MRDDIIADIEDFGLGRSLRQPGDGAETGRKKGHPIFKNNQIGTQVFNSFTHLTPGQRNNRIDNGLGWNLDAFIRAAVHLSFTREKYFRILTLEGNNIHLVFSFL